MARVPYYVLAKFPKMPYRHVMKSAKLFIVAIDGSQGPEEVKRSAKGLYDKYSSRGEVNKQVEVVFLGRNGKVRSGGEFEKLCVGKVEIEKDDVLGMYLVAHCGDLSTAVYDHNLAEGIKAFLDLRAGGNSYKLDKVCLAVCAAATKELEKESPLGGSEEKTLIQQFATLLIKAGMTPRLAGWTASLTVDPSGKKKIIGSRKPIEMFVTDSPISKEKQKMVYVYDESAGYVRKDLASWTDK